MHDAGSERDRFLLVIFYGVLPPVGCLAFRIISPFPAALAWAAVFEMVRDPSRSSAEAA
jgi:hypothetical protein